MVNLSPLAAEIGPVVWGTPADFNGFRVLAALLDGTPAVGVIQTLRRWTEGATYNRQATITLGIGPHSSFFFFPRLISAVADWVSAIRGSLKIKDAKSRPKIVIWAPSHKFVGLYLRN